MSSQSVRFKVGAIVATLLPILTLMVGWGFSQSTSGHVIANNTPRFTADAQNLGAEDSSKRITVTVWLNQHNKAGLDEAVRQMYQKGSPNYHQWLTGEQYKANFAPTAQDAATVRNFLEARNLKVSAIDRNNHFVTAQGRVADVQKAFQVQLNRYSVRGEVLRANTADPVIEGPAGTLVSSIQGFTDLTYKPYARRPIDPDTGKPFPGIPLAAGTHGLFFAGNCFRSPETDVFTTPGGGPTATYTGNRYGTNIDSKVPNLPPCGYSPAEVHKAYGMDAVYQKNIKGQKQTIVIVDAFGSPTIQADANTFSSLNHLPALTNSNFAVVNIGGPTGCTPADGCDPAGWVGETTLDVEWAHAVAPAANILLIQTFDNTFGNLDQGVLYAAEGGVAAPFGNVISNSYGIEEGILAQFAPAELNVQNSINELAAAFGVSANFSSGDDGDFHLQVGAPDVSAPASSPFATSVGGTSLFLNPDKTMNFQTGWGNNETRIANITPNPPVVPPLHLGFVFGSGGGTSRAFSKPSFQKSLGGGKRKVPDVGFLADPFTGVEIVIDDGTGTGGQVVEVFGGTSLACPMFSAMWALANQAAGVGPLGQAAPLLYGLPADAFSDVQQIGSATDPTGVVTFPPFKPVFESAKSLAQPLGNTKNFVSALYNSPFSTRWFVLTFGTDTSLTTGPGWDNVTGLGTPNGLSFVQDVAAEVAPSASTAH